MKKIIGKMSDVKETKESTKGIVFFGLGVLFIVIGLILTPSVSDILLGYKRMLIARVMLDINFFGEVGNYVLADCQRLIGVPIINSGVLIIIVTLSYLLTKTPMKGGQIAAMFMVFGFGSCGKSLYNIWPTFFGVLLFAKVNKKKISSVMNIAWFSTALCPVFSIFAFYPLYNGLNQYAAEPTFQISNIIIGILVGMLAGYGVGFFADILPTKHQGYLLYNVGFAAGVTGFLLFSVMKAAGFGHQSPGYSDAASYFNINNKVLGMVMVITHIYLLLCGLIITKGKGIAPILKRSEKGGELVSLMGFGPSLLNMGVIGLICIAYVSFISIKLGGGNWSGPVFAALLTATGASSNGITVKTALPVMLGVFVMSVISSGLTAVQQGLGFFDKISYVGTKNMTIAALYACGISPVVGGLGVVAGVLAGMFHSVLVPNLGALHGWLNLYNNGFCLGLVATFYVHICERFATKKQPKTHG